MIRFPCRNRLADLVLAPIAVLAVLGQDLIWPFILVMGRRVAGWRPLVPLRRRLADLSPLAALPLFLVPEVCSRIGTVISAWLLLQGDAWRALAIYAAFKLVAGGSALWIYTACEPALLKNRAFATIHGALGSLRRSMVARMQQRLPRTGRFAALSQRIRARHAGQAVTAAARRNVSPPP